MSTEQPVDDIIEIDTKDYRAPNPLAIPVLSTSADVPEPRPATEADLFSLPPVEAPKIDPLNIDQLLSESRLPDGRIDFSAVKEAQDRYWANFSASMEQMKISNASRFPSASTSSTGVPSFNPPSAGRGMMGPPGMAGRGGPFSHRGATPLPTPQLPRITANGVESTGGRPISFTSEDLPQMRLQQRIAAMEAERKRL